MILNIQLLDPLLEVDTPYCVLKHLVAQYAKLLPYDIASRRAFVISSGLAKIQQIAMKYAPQLISADLAASNKSKVSDEDNPYMDENATNNSKLAEAIRTINSCYPEEIVHYYSPGYSTLLLEKLNNYKHDGTQNESGDTNNTEEISGLQNTTNDSPDSSDPNLNSATNESEVNITTSSNENINNDDAIDQQESSD